MIVRRVRIGGKQFVLDATQDVAVLKQQMTDAVRGGGGFVSLASAGNGTVDVLITSELTVWFEDVTAGLADGSGYLAEYADRASLADDQVFELDEFPAALSPV